MPRADSSSLRPRLRPRPSRFPTQIGKIALQSADIGGHAVLPLHQPPSGLGVGLARLERAVHVLPDFALALSQLLGAARRVLHLALDARRLAPLQCARRVAQAIRRRPGFSFATTLRSRRTTHRVRRFLQPPRGLGNFGVLLLASQLLQPARQFLSLLRELALR